MIYTLKDLQQVRAQGYKQAWHDIARVALGIVLLACIVVSAIIASLI